MADTDLYDEKARGFMARYGFDDSCALDDLADLLRYVASTTLEKAAQLCIERCQNRATGAVLAGLIRELEK